MSWEIQRKCEQEYAAQQVKITQANARITCTNDAFRTVHQILAIKSKLDTGLLFALAFNPNLGKVK